MAVVPRYTPPSSSASASGQDPRQRRPVSENGYRRGWWLGWERGGAGGDNEEGRTRRRVVRVVSNSPKDAGECPWRRGWSESYVHICMEVIEKRDAVWKVPMGHHPLRKARRGARGGRSPPRRLLAQGGAGATPWKEADPGRHTSWPGDGWPLSATGPSGRRAPPPPSTALHVNWNHACPISPTFRAVGKALFQASPCGELAPGTSTTLRCHRRRPRRRRRWPCRRVASNSPLHRRRRCEAQ